MKWLALFLALGSPAWATPWIKPKPAVWAKRIPKGSAVRIKAEIEGDFSQWKKKLPGNATGGEGSLSCRLTRIGNDGGGDLPEKGFFTIEDIDQEEQKSGTNLAWVLKPQSGQIPLFLLKCEKWFTVPHTPPNIFRESPLLVGDLSHWVDVWTLTEIPEEPARKKETLSLLPSGEKSGLASLLAEEGRHPAPEAGTARYRQSRRLQKLLKEPLKDLMRPLVTSSSDKSKKGLASSERLHLDLASVYRNPDQSLMITGDFMVMSRTATRERTGFLAKLTPGGSIQWLREYQVYQESPLIRTVHPASDGGYLLSGYYTGALAFLGKTDAEGNLVKSLFMRHRGARSIVFAYDFIEWEKDRYVVIGHSWDTTPKGTVYAVLEIDLAGTVAARHAVRVPMEQGDIVIEAHPHWHLFRSANGSLLGGRKEEPVFEIDPAGNISASLGSVEPEFQHDLVLSPYP